MTGMIAGGWEDNWEFVTYAYAITWIVLVAYIVSLWMRSKKT